MAIPISETVVSFRGHSYKISKIAYTGLSTTFVVDQSAIGVASVLPVSGAPAATIGASGVGADDGEFEKTVTLAAGSVAAEVTVITVHNGTLTGSNS